MYPINPTIFERESHESVPDEQLVEKMVDPVPPSVDRNFPIESEDHNAQVLLVSSDSTRQGGSSPIPMTHSPSSMVNSFDWSQLVGSSSSLRALPDHITRL